MIGADTPWVGKTAGFEVVGTQWMFNAPCYTDDPSSSLLSIPYSVLLVTQAPFLSAMAVPNAFLRVVNYPTRLTVQQARNLTSFVIKQPVYVVMVPTDWVIDLPQSMVAVFVLEGFPLLRLDLDSGHLAVFASVAEQTTASGLAAAVLHSARAWIAVWSADVPGW
jgi:hypothetical protein